MKILVAASSTDADPVNAAARFPWPVGSELHVLSVAEIIQPVMIGMIPDTIDAGAVQVSTNEEAQKTARNSAQHLRDLGFAAEGIEAEGDAETAIIDHAKEWGADLIVVGSHNRTLIERLLVGSVSERVIKHAPCSVLVVKEGGIPA